jgi:hypothetical protein
MQVPTATNVTVAVLTVHTEVVSEEKETGNPVASAHGGDGRAPPERSIERRIVSVSSDGRAPSICPRTSQQRS